MHENAGSIKKMYPVKNRYIHVLLPTDNKREATQHLVNLCHCIIYLLHHVSVDQLNAQQQQVGTLQYWPSGQIWW